LVKVALKQVHFRVHVYARELFRRDRNRGAIEINFLW